MKQLLKNNKKIITMILMITLLLWTIAGVSFAAYNFINDAEDNAINLGQVSMTYTEPSNEVILKNALPKKDELGKNQEEYFEFSVMSHATTNTDDDNGIVIPYEISISKVEVDASKKELEDNQVKVYLTRLDGASEIDVLKPTLVSSLKQSDYDSNGYKVYDGSDTHSNNNDSKTTKYRIRFWVDENVDVSNWATTNEYEYKFKVNVNAKSERNTSITLSKAIKSMYTLDNGAAKKENGYYYLTGTEVLEGLTTEQMTLNVIGEYSNVYYYQKADGTYDQEQFDSDVKNYFINAGAVSETEYNRMTGPFGGYLNAMIGMTVGVVTEDPDTYDFVYVGGKTIDDIPTLDEAMADENTKPLIIENIGSAAGACAAFNPTTFLKLYSDGSRINEELLNEKMEQGLIAYEEADLVTALKVNFGNLSNYAIAEAHEYTTEDADGNPIFIEGITVDDLPTLDELLLNYAGPTLIKNNYIRLNNLLYKVIGVNSDNTVKLLLVENISTISATNLKIEEADYSKYLGIGEKNEKNSPFLHLFKDTTLNDLLIKKDYKYIDENNEKYINSYISLLTQEEIEKSYGDLEQSFLLSNYGDYDPYPIARYTKNKAKFLYGYEFVEEGSTTSYEQVYLAPVITIEDIKIEGTGTKNDPYTIKNEKKSQDLIVAESIYMYLNGVFSYTEFLSQYGSYFRNIWKFNDSYPYIFEDNFTYYRNYNFDLENSSLKLTENGNLSVALNINGICYYNDVYGKIYKSEDTGSCVAQDRDVPIIYKINGVEQIEYRTYNNYEEISLLLEGVKEGVTYQWQYYGDSYTWYDLVDGNNVIDDSVSFTASGVDTNELKIIPKKGDNYMEFRCVFNGLKSKTMVLNIYSGMVENIVVTPAMDVANSVDVYYGEKVNIKADVTGASGYYLQHYYDGHNQKILSGDITELGKSTLSIDVNVDENFINNHYYLYIEGAEAYGDVLRIYISGKGPEIVTQPKSLELGIGKTATFNVEAKGALYYQWQQKIGDEWVNLEDIENKVSGSTTNTLEITTTSEMELETNYRCVLKSKEEIYTDEVTLKLFETDEEWAYEKIVDEDGIPTGEYEVFRYIGPYQASDSVVVKENYFTETYFRDKISDADGSYTYASFLYTIAPEVLFEVIEKEYNVAREDLTEYHVSFLYQDQLGEILGIDKSVNDIDWTQYVDEHIDAYDITLPISYKGANVIGVKKTLFTQPVKLIYSDQDKIALEEYKATGNVEQLYSNHITSITIPEGYLYIGNDYTEEEFEEKYSFMNSYTEEENLAAAEQGIDPFTENSPFVYLNMLEDMKLASTIKTIGTRALSFISMYYSNLYNTRTLELPRSLETLSYQAMYNHGPIKIKFQEGAVIKELKSDTFSVFTIGLEVPASVEKIEGRIVDFVNDECDTTSLMELTFENTVERPSQLKVIGEDAFYGSMIKELEIPASVETIEAAAFASVSYLDIGATITPTRYLEKLTFEDTPERPSQLKTVSPYAFNDNLPDGVVFPNGIVYGG